MNQPYDWSRFNCSIFVQAPPSRVFDAWTLPEALEKWLIAECRIEAADGHKRAPSERLATGDRYQWLSSDQKTKNTGHILDVTSSKRFKFTFGMSEGMPINVTVAFEPQGDGCCVKLQQDSIGRSEASRLQWHVGGLKSWTFYLTNLKAVLESGVDLREKDPARMNDGAVNF